jgi:large subunit ribosomal protein L30
MAELKVTQVRSTIGVKPKARGTMRALGLRGIGQTNVLPDRPEIQGMIRKVSHLVTVEEAAAPEKKKAAPKAKAKAEPKATAKDDVEEAEEA